MIRSGKREEPGAALVKPEIGPQLPATLRPLVESAMGYAAEARAPATHRAYRYQLQRFESWARALGLATGPAAPGTVALYIAACADEGLAAATISQAMSAIGAWHREKGLSSPCMHPQVREVWRGIARKIGIAQERKDPLEVATLRAMLEAAPDDALGARDRALLVIGFAGGFRRSELVAVNVDDVTFVTRGVEILVGKSKTDQYGRGLTKVIATGDVETSCPVRLLRRWLEASRIVEGPVFRPVDRHGNIGEKALSGHAVAEIVKRAAARAGFKETEKLAGHSLRGGFVTEAKKHGADDKAIMDQTGHRSVQMLLRYYTRINQWEKPASAKLGL